MYMYTIFIKEIYIQSRFIDYTYILILFSARHFITEVSRIFKRHVHIFAHVQYVSSAGNRLGRLVQEGKGTQ